MREFDGRSKLGTWLTRIAINSALMILRKKKRASPEIATDSNDKFDADGLRCEISDHVPNPEKRYGPERRRKHAEESDPAPTTDPPGHS